MGGNAYWFVFPRGYYVRGLSYEAMGKLDKAKENYKSLLDLWKNADATIPELIDTRKRLSSIFEIIEVTFYPIITKSNWFFKRGENR